MSPTPVEVTEVRVLEGPNLYFTKPAVKVSLSCPGYLAADSADLTALARRLTMRGVRPGEPQSEQRQRFLMRVTAHVVRLVARRSGVSRVGIRTRSGATRADVVTAFPWHNRSRAVAMGEALGPVMAALLDPDPAVGDRALDDTVAALAAAPPGSPPLVVRPKVPVASITGTNGKTTTTRLLAHIGMTCGRLTAWSSTDGVLAQGVLVERGDYSGPAGARTVLATPGLQLGILETARGGMLLKGMGVSANDVSVVTNVSADHLGLQGIDTVDQLAEVKAIVTRVTKPQGWAVLNGDDPRVWAMRAGLKARPWAFSLDPDSPALREAVNAGGRGITVLDGQIVVTSPVGDPDQLLPIVDVPVTLAGLSDHNTANALAAAAAALGLGLPRAGVVEGLRTFTPDPAHNPGRMNIYSAPLAEGQATVIIDLAHNEAGLEALLAVAAGLRPPGATLHLGLGTGGDRTDEILQTLGELAGRRADRVSVVHKAHYLRGRTMESLEAQLRLGLGRVGVAEADSYDSELAGLQGMLATAADGDVLAVMVHADRELLDEWLRSVGATADDADDIRRKVVTARGEHELEPQIASLWRTEDAAARLDAAYALLGRRPGDARLTYEVGGCLDAAGRGPEALAAYDQALASGLREPHRHRALLQKAVLLRALGDPGAAFALLDDLAAARPGSVTIAGFRALAAYDVGQPAAALADALDVLLAHAADQEFGRYRGLLQAETAALRTRA